MALRQQGFQVAPGLLFASTWPLFTSLVVLAPNATRLEGKAHAKQRGSTGRGALPEDRARVGLGRLGQILPNGTAWGLQESVAHCQVGFP